MKALVMFLCIGASACGSATNTPKTLSACDALPSVGTWENATPAAIHFSRWCVPDFNPTTGCGNPGVYGATGPIPTYGSNAFAVIDPAHGTIILGTAQLGIWKSSDCGASWTKLNTTGTLTGPGVAAGATAALLDQGRQWTMVMDPSNSSVIYTVAGYGQGGVFRSIDGGTDWVQILPQTILDVTGAGFIEKIAMDPTDHTHLLVSFHTPCTGTPLPGATTDSMGNWGCLAESTNAGADWTLTTGIPWAGFDGPGQTMVGPKIWFYATNSSQAESGGRRRAACRSAAPRRGRWSIAATFNGSVYIASNGIFYCGNVQSSDGINWVPADTPNIESFNGSTPMIDDGKTMFVGSSTLPAAGGTSYFWSAPLATSPLSYTLMPAPTPPMDTGVAYVAYDSARHILYASNMWGGFWRTVVTP